MSDLTRIQPLLLQAQTAVAELEALRVLSDPRVVPPALAVLIRELEVASRALQDEVALLGSLLKESESLMDRFDAIKSELTRQNDE